MQRVPSCCQVGNVLLVRYEAVRSAPVVGQRHVGLLATYHYAYCASVGVVAALVNLRVGYHIRAVVLERELKHENADLVVTVIVHSAVVFIAVVDFNHVVAFVETNYAACRLTRYRLVCAAAILLVPCVAYSAHVARHVEGYRAVAHIVACGVHLRSTYLQLAQFERVVVGTSRIVRCHVANRYAVAACLEVSERATEALVSVVPRCRHASISIVNKRSQRHRARHEVLHVAARENHFVAIRTIAIECATFYGELYRARAAFAVVHHVACNVEHYLVELVDVDRER